MLGASWLSNPATDTAHANVTGAALTVAKGADKTSGGLGTVINYTLSYATSEYYSALATDGADARSRPPARRPGLRHHDRGARTDSIQHNSGRIDGRHVDRRRGRQHKRRTISFAAHVDTNWEDPGYAGDPIVSGDSMVNNVDISGVASDNVEPGAPEIPTTSADSVGFSTHLPSINKYMLRPGTGTWSRT